MNHLTNLKRGLMIPALLLNVIKTLIIDKAQDLAAEHVKGAIERNLSYEDKEALDKLVDEMPDNAFKNVKEFLQG